MTDAQLEQWVTRTLEPVVEYYGKLPLPHLLIVIAPSNRGVHGVTLGHGGASVLLTVSPSVDGEQALAHWVPTHELVHVLFPSVTPRHSWLEEGLATYIEPLVRVRAGRIGREKFWRDLIKGLPQGLPQPGDRGLNRTRTWGRTYWGGAIFWLIADTRVRVRSRGARSVDDALRAILQDGGNVSVDWPIDRVLKTADEATGGSDFRDLYDQMAFEPGAPGLTDLFESLGVRLVNDRIQFEDRAPLASTRAAITAASHPASHPASVAPW